MLFHQLKLAEILTYICAVFLSGIHPGCSGDPQGSLGSALRRGGRGRALSWHHGSPGTCHTDGCCRADAPWEASLVCTETLCTFPFSSEGIAGLVSSSFPRATHPLPESTHLLPRFHTSLPGICTSLVCSFHQVSLGSLITITRNQS